MTLGAPRRKHRRWSDVSVQPTNDNDDNAATTGDLNRALV
jgi:hypothetical protein